MMIEEFLPYVKWLVALAAGLIVGYLLNRGKVTPEKLIKVKEILKQLLPLTPDSLTREAMTSIIVVLGYFTNEGYTATDAGAALDKLKRISAASGAPALRQWIEELEADL